MSVTLVVRHIFNGTITRRDETNFPTTRDLLLTCKYKYNLIYLIKVKCDPIEREYTINVQNITVKMHNTLITT